MANAYSSCFHLLVMKIIFIFMHWYAYVIIYMSCLLAENYYIFSVTPVNVLIYYEFIIGPLTQPIEFITSTLQATESMLIAD